MDLPILEASQEHILSRTQLELESFLSFAYEFREFVNCCAKWLDIEGGASICLRYSPPSETCCSNLYSACFTTHETIFRIVQHVVFDGWSLSVLADTLETERGWIRKFSGSDQD